MLRDLVVGQPPQAAVLSRTIGRKRLKPGPPSAGSSANRKLPRQKRLRATVPSGWPSTARNDARRAVGLRHALHEHQKVPVRIGIDGARPQRVLAQRHGVVVGVVVGRAPFARSPSARRRRRCADIGRSPAASPSCGLGGRCDGSLRDHARQVAGRRGPLLDRSCGARLLGMLNVEPLVARRRLRRRRRACTSRSRNGRPILKAK